MAIILNWPKPYPTAYGNKGYRTRVMGSKVITDEAQIANLKEDKAFKADIKSGILSMKEVAAEPVKVQTSNTSDEELNPAGAGGSTSTQGTAVSALKAEDARAFIVDCVDTKVLVDIFRNEKRKNQKAEDGIKKAARAKLEEILGRELSDEELNPAGAGGSTSTQGTAVSALKAEDARAFIVDCVDTKVLVDIFRNEKRKNQKAEDGIKKAARAKLEEILGRELSDEELNPAPSVT